MLRLVAAGRSNSDIAAEMFLAESTVKSHVNRVFAKLGVRGRVQAVVLAYESGFVAPGSGTLDTSDASHERDRLGRAQADFPGERGLWQDCSSVQSAETTAPGNTRRVSIQLLPQGDRDAAGTHGWPFRIHH